ncbi:MAG: hypothetical protein MUC60_11910 [Oscillatoria sp. Prado101]|nr:hypothetical protein [Oscillatoria sp. Prado101]
MGVNLIKTLRTDSGQGCPHYGNDWIVGSASISSTSSLHRYPCRHIGKLYYKL